MKGDFSQDIHWIGGAPLSMLGGNFQSQLNQCKLSLMGGLCVEEYVGGSRRLSVEEYFLLFSC